MQLAIFRVSYQVSNYNDKSLTARQILVIYGAHNRQWGCVKTTIEVWINYGSCENWLLYTDVVRHTMFFTTIPRKVDGHFHETPGVARAPNWRNAGTVSKYFYVAKTDHALWKPYNLHVWINLIQSVLLIDRQFRWIIQWTRISEFRERSWRRKKSPSSGTRI